MRIAPKLALLTAALSVFGCRTTSEIEPGEIAYSARQERVRDFAALVPDAPRTDLTRAARLERVTTAVPWPRGIAWVDGELVVLARGRHRNSGGIDYTIEDRTGALFRVDPNVAEPVVLGELASGPVTKNAALLVEPDPTIFHLPNKKVAPIDDTLMDRPYCTLAYDAASQNLFICGYSGVDLPESKFRKNATDSIHRFDLRTERWYRVEQHDPTVVPEEELGYVVSNEYYPHHDPATNAAPHGWLNGPDGCVAAGQYLYAFAKENHSIVQYDLAEIRENPEAGYPDSRPVIGPHVLVSHPDGVEEMEILGPSAAAYRDGYLYVGYRTTSVILRFPLEDDGDLVEGAAAELVAVFEPYSAERRRSGNLIDIAFNSKGELFASCAKEAKIWNVGVPDPKRPFLANDQLERPTSAPPYVNLVERTGEHTGSGNIMFDDQDRLYICSGNYDSNSEKLAGVIYRVIPTSGS